jgi:hypothetical protein
MLDLWDRESEVCSVNGPTPAEAAESLRQPAEPSATTGPSPLPIRRAAPLDVPVGNAKLADALTLASGGSKDARFVPADVSDSEAMGMTAAEVLHLHAESGVSLTAKEYTVDSTGTIARNGKPMLVAVGGPTPERAAPRDPAPEPQERLILHPDSSPEFERQVADAFAYLRRSPTAAALISDVMHGPVDVTLIERQHSMDQNPFVDQPWPAEFDPDDKTIEFNPTLGIRTPEGAILSPALVLAHELGHIRECTRNPTRDLLEAVTPDPNFPNARERRNCIDVEFRIADELGEPLHLSRRHVGVFVESSTSTTPVDLRTIDWTAKKPPGAVD